MKIEIASPSQRKFGLDCPYSKDKLKHKKQYLSLLKEFILDQFFQQKHHLILLKKKKLGKASTQIEQMKTCTDMPMKPYPT